MFKVNVKAGNNYGEMRKIWLFIVFEKFNKLKYLLTLK
jgi:hypothetical protein